MSFDRILDVTADVFFFINVCQQWEVTPLCVDWLGPEEKEEEKETEEKRFNSRVCLVACGMYDMCS